MVDYRRMGIMEQRLGNTTTQLTWLHDLRHLWKSPRGTVIRIEALTLMAISLSFLAACGSFRRWSNRFIIQKGFLVANALFLSLGTYSIGLMQSSSVKSEMYPVWAVYLLCLLCCVDSVTAYSLDFKSQIWKMIYQLCLYCGYVLLMSISTISSGVGNIAVGVLSIITFIKGFHRTLAIMLPGRMRYMIRAVPDRWSQKISTDRAESVTQGILVVHLSIDNVESRTIPDDKFERGGDPIILPTEVKWSDGDVTLLQINSRRAEDNTNNDQLPLLLGADVDACKEVCLSFSLSHVLQRRFLGCDRLLEIRTHDDSLVSNWIVLKKRDDGSIDYERAFKVVEVELAFLYDILFTSNAFLSYYQAKAASIWALASVIGVLFVGAVSVAIPRTRTIHNPGGTTVVDTTTGDLVVTGVVVLCLALLQVLQLLRCWTSNWARVAFACDYVRNQRNAGPMIQRRMTSWQMRLRAYLSKIYWFESYLWQNNLGQHSLVDESVISTRRECKLYREFKGWLSQKYYPLSRMLGLQYFEQMLQELWGSRHTGAAIELHADVKAAIADLAIRGIKSNDEEATGWSSYSTPVPDRRLMRMSRFNDFIDYEKGRLGADKYTCLVLIWHIATCYCELSQCSSEMMATIEKKNHRVATAVSRYCAYLVVSAPRLLPGQYMDTKDAYDAVAGKVGEVVVRGVDKLGSMERAIETEVLGSVKDQLYQIERRRTRGSERLHKVMEELGAAAAAAAAETTGRDDDDDIWTGEACEVLEGVKKKLGAIADCEWEMCWLQVMKDELDAVERRMELRGAPMEKGKDDDKEIREGVLQVKDQLDAIRSEMATEMEALQRLVDDQLTMMGRESSCSERGWELLALHGVKQRLAALDKERERVTQAMCGARDKLRLMNKARKRIGIRPCPKNAEPEDKIFWSGLELGNRLQTLLSTPDERWKLLAEFWVKALVYAAPSDNVEDHMHRLAQGGEFITHLWALLSHHGILRWQQESEDTLFSPRRERASGTTRIYSGVDSRAAREEDES